MRGNLRFRLLLLAGLLAVALPTAVGAYTVRPEHPRLLLTPQRVPLLRARAQTTHADILGRLRDWADNQIRMGMKNCSFCDDYAFLYLMTQDPAHRDWAIEATLYNAKRNTEVGGEGSALGRVSSIVLAYDWLYNDLTPAQRDTIERAFVPYVRDHKPTYNGAAAWLPYDVYYSYALAICGEGVADADAAEGLDISYRRYTERFLPALNEVGTGGGVDGYGGERTQIMYVMAEMFRSALNEDWTAQSSFIQNSGEFWMHRLRGDLRLLRVPGKYNLANTNMTEYYAYFAGTFRNPNWQALANRYREDPEAWDPTSAWQLILWYDPSIPSDWPPAALSYRCTGSGMVFMRDTWDVGPASRAIHSGFFCGPDLVRTRAQGHFVIARGADNLLIDSGTYQHDVDNHYMPYYIRAIAHNTLLVVEPLEDFGTFTNYYNETFDIPNDGGQQESDRDLGCVKYPAAECTYGYRGEIDRFVDNGDYLYARSDMSASYSTTKATRVTREFVYVRPDIFVIRDLVRRRSPAYKTKAVFHMVDRPTVNGTFSVVHGNLSTGGVFECAPAREALVARGTSQARIRFMKPDAGAGLLRMVGGANSSGRAWRQSWDAIDTNTFDASSSYEFWVQDRNWISCGLLCSEGEIATRNDSPANESGDWRIEIEAASTGTDVSFVTFIKVGPRNEPQLPARLIDTPTAEGVAITRAPGDTLVVAFQRGEGLQEVRY